MSAQQEIKVWDLLVRVFHWSLVFLFLISYLTGDEESSIHVWSGYGIVGLLVVRFIWGVIGTKHARFSDFIYSPATVITYLKDVLTGRAKRYIGHNPAGGAMIVALLISLSVTTLTGMMVYGVEEGEGPFAGLKTAEQSITVPSFSLISTVYADDDEHEHEEGDEGENEFLEEVHEFFANFTVLLILIHLGGVFIESVLHKENLVRAMIHGKKIDISGSGRKTMR